MMKTLCDMVVEHLEREFGPPLVIGGIYRWKITSAAPEVPLVLAVDHCDDTVVRVWLFDTHCRNMDGVTDFAVNAPREIEPALSQIHRTIAEINSRRPQRFDGHDGNAAI